MKTTIRFDSIFYELYHTNQKNCSTCSPFCSVDCLNIFISLSRTIFNFESAGYLITSLYYDDECYKALAPSRAHHLRGLGVYTFLSEGFQTTLF